MDEKTTIAQLGNMVRLFCEERNWDQFHSAKDLAIGVVTEASELLDKFRFKSEQETTEMLRELDRREEVGDELADVLYFLLRFAQMNKFDLSTEFVRKMEKNAEKYPLNTSLGSNKKYSEIRQNTHM
ncbi:MAG: nucleotide pyrophosphohydrolase [Leptospirales bacterium]